MTKQILIDEPGLVLCYYPETKIIHDELRKYPGAAALQAALEPFSPSLPSRLLRNQHSKKEPNEWLTVPPASRPEAGSSLSTRASARVS